MTDQIAAAGNTQTTGDATPAPATAALLGAEIAGTQQQATEVQAPAADAQQTADTTQATDPAAAEGVKPEGAPESYDFKAPEGFVLDDAVIGEFSNVAKELGLSQDAAQKIVDKLSPKLAERTAQAQQEAVTKYRAELVDQVKADKEIGGDKLNERLAVADKALSAFGTPELRTLLNTSGLGDHPEIIRAFYRAGKAISDDVFVPGGARQATTGNKTIQQVLYDK